MKRGKFMICKNCSTNFDDNAPYCPYCGAPVMAVISLIEGILYLTKSDAEFYQTYVQNKKEWF